MICIYFSWYSGPYAKTASQGEARTFVFVIEMDALSRAPVSLRYPAFSDKAESESEFGRATRDRPTNSAG